MFRPGETFTKGDTKTTGVLDPMAWLPEELYSVFREAPTGLGEEHIGALGDNDDDPQFTEPPL
jgi:hypothetical protein